MFNVNPYENFINQFFKNDLIKQATESQQKFVKMAETNAEKIQAFFKDSQAQAFNAETKKRDFEQFFHVDQLLKSFGHTHQLYIDQFEKISKVSKEHQEKNKELFGEHQKLATQLKEELTAGIQTKEVKDVVGAITNYSKAVTASNVEVLDKSIKELKSAVSA